MRGMFAIRPILTCAGAVLVAVSAPAMAQATAGYAYQQQAETPSDALARYLRVLASDPKDFSSLIGAGKAALQIGDPQAAAGFFARADEVNSRSPLPQAGMGAVSVANGEATAAMPYFTRALQLGAAPSQIGCDRGLAYDLMGQQKLAQADYRAALNGPDATEARRRLALSLAISGDKAGAIQTLAPLSAMGDAAAGRVRAFVLALSGDSQGAMVAIDAAMPGSWSRVSPFLQRLPTLAAGQKAAAVNLGIFPGEAPIASSSISSTYAARVTPTSNVVDRLAGIEEQLRQPEPAAPTQRPTWQSAPAAPQVAYVAPVRRQIARANVEQPKVWLQLASGQNAQALPDQFRRLKSRNRDLFDGISGYVAKSSDRARLVIGPFRGSLDAETFAEDLHTIGVDAFSWTNSPTDQIVPLGTE
jgi:tetratricopeptide (TPR) repeat protein